MPDLGSARLGLRTGAGAALMAERRSTRQDTVSSPLTLLREIEPVNRSLCNAMSRVKISGGTYVALEAATAALARLAAELGHPGFFSTPQH